MKTIKLFLTTTAVAVAIIATGVEKPKLNLVPLTAQKAIVSVSNENAAFFEVSVETHGGDLLYYKQSKKPLTEYQKIFDFDNLEQGDDVLNLKTNATRVSLDFEINKSGIEIGNLKTYFDPYFQYKDEVLKFSYLNFEKENVKLKIYRENELIYTSEVGNDFAISKGYDLSKLEKGKYHVRLTSMLNDFSYNLEK